MALVSQPPLINTFFFQLSIRYFVIYGTFLNSVLFDGLVQYRFGGVFAPTMLCLAYVCDISKLTPKKFSGGFAPDPFSHSQHPSTKSLDPLLRIEKINDPKTKRIEKINVSLKNCLLTSGSQSAPFSDSNNLDYELDLSLKHSYLPSALGA